MKCKNCGADIKAGSKFCEFCGSQISLDMQKEMEQLNKAGCPKCGSSNIKFEREKQAEVKGKKGTSIVRATVGVCNDCGYTWETHDNRSESKSNKLWLWILGWIFIFPVPLTILMLRNKDIKIPEYEISKDKIYCLGIRAEELNGEIIIGEGTLLSRGEYSIINPITIPSSTFQFLSTSLNSYVLIKFNQDIKNPYNL